MVILDLHEYNAMAADPVGKKPMFLAFWRQIAPRYKDTPSSVLFEIMNEPADEVHGASLERLLPRGAGHHPGDESGQDGRHRAGELEQPVRPGLSPSASGRPEHHRHGPLLQSLSVHPSGRRLDPRVQGSLRRPWLGTDADRAAIRKDFEGAQKWAEAENRPLFLGEFGAYDKAEMASRARYTAAIARTAESLGWSWAYWQFDSDFILYDIDKEQWVEPISRP